MMDKQGEGDKNSRHRSRTNFDKLIGPAKGANIYGSR